MAVVVSHMRLPMVIRVDAMSGNQRCRFWLRMLICTVLTSLTLLAPPLQGATVAADNKAELHLVPWPQSVQVDEGRFELQPSADVVVDNPALMPIARLLVEELEAVLGQRLKAASHAPRPGDIVLHMTTSKKDEAYQLQVKDVVAVSGGSYRAVASGTATLLQLCRREGTKTVLPRVVIEDWPESAYRGVLIDVGAPVPFARHAAPGDSPVPTVQSAFSAVAPDR